MDDRGQPIQVGAILLFGFLVIAFSIFQAVVVPQQNEEVEFDHNQEVHRDVVELRNSIVRAANVGENGAASVALGTRYQARLFGVNPGPAGGLLQTTDPRVMNITSASPPHKDHSGLCPTSNETVGISYTPTYNYYGEAPRTVYEHSFVFDEYDDTERVATPARLLFGVETSATDDNVVNLVSMWGNVSKGGVQTASVDVYRGEVNSEMVTDPIIELPTRASNETWAEALDFSSNDPGAESLHVSDGYVTIELSGTYEVVCTEVGLNRAPPSGIQNLGTGSGGGGGGGASTASSTPTSSANGLSDVSASDLGTTGDETQTFQFTLTTDLEAGESVTIDLSEAQGGNKVDYGAATTGGSDSTVSQNGNSAAITYSTSNTVGSGTEISIDVSGIDANGSQAATSSPYSVDFTRSDTEGVESDEFTVS